MLRTCSALHSLRSLQLAHNFAPKNFNGVDGSTSADAYQSEASKKYLSASRKTFQSGKVTEIENALQIVSDEIAKQKTNIAAAHAKELERLDKEEETCIENGEVTHRAAEKVYTAMAAEAKADLKSALAAMEKAQAEEQSASDAENKAQAEFDAAVALLAAQRVSLAKTLVDEKAAAETHYSAIRTAYTNGKATSLAYLADEMRDLATIKVTIKEAQLADPKQQTQFLEVAKISLLQISQRLQHHVLQRIRADPALLKTYEGNTGSTYKYENAKKADRTSIKGKLEGFISNLRDRLGAARGAAMASMAATETAAEATEKQVSEAADVVYKAVLLKTATHVADDLAIKVAKTSAWDGKVEVHTLAKAHTLAMSEIKASALEKQVSGLATAKAIKTASYATAESNFNTNLLLVDSKKSTALTYLGNERKTVAQIEKLVGDLGKDYTFTVPAATTTPTTLLEVSKSQKQMTSAQKDALTALVGMAQSYSADTNSNNGMSAITAGQKATVQGVLDLVKTQITAEEGKVASNHKADMVIIDGERKTAEDNADSAFTATEKLLQGAVDVATTNHNSAVAAELVAKNEEATALGEKTTAEANHSTAVEEKVNFDAAALDVKTADDGAASEYEAAQKQAAADEIKEDLRIIDAELASLKQMENMLKTIDLTNFLQITASPTSASVEARTSYSTAAVTEAGTSLRQRVEALVTKIETKLDAEITRLNTELSDDTTNNDNAKSTKDAEARLNHKNNQASLNGAIAKHQAAHGVSAADLAAKTAAHVTATDRYQLETDQWFTATETASANAAKYQADYDQTATVSTQLLKEQKEMINNRFTRSTFYLSTHSSALKSIKTMLESLDMTTAATGATPDTAAYQKRVDYNNNERDTHFNARNAAETARVSEYVDQRTDNTITDATALGAGAVRKNAATYGTSNTNVRVNDKTAAGYTVQDAAFMELSTQMKAGKITVAQFIDQLVAAVQAESNQVNADHVKETTAYETSKETLDTAAANEQKKLIATDAVQTTKEADEMNAQAGVVAAALKAKNAAQATHDSDQNLLNDALATKNTHFQDIEDTLAANLAANKIMYDQVAKTNKQKHEDGTTYLENEKAVLTEVRTAVKQMGINDAVLMQLVEKVVRSHLANKGKLAKYDFTKTSMAAMKDTNSDTGSDYIESAHAAKNVYTGDKSSINELLEETSAGLAKELEAVVAAYKADKVFLDNKKEKELAAHDTTHQATYKKFADITAGKLVLRKSAEKAEADQLVVLDAAKAATGVARTNHATSVNDQSASKVHEAKVMGDRKAETQSEHDSDVAAYNGEALLATNLIGDERKLLAEIKKILSGGVIEAKSADKVDRCTAERQAQLTASVKASASEIACTKAKISASKAGKSIESLAECATASADAGASTTATASYRMCLGEHNDEHDLDGEHNDEHDLDGEHNDEHDLDGEHALSAVPEDMHSCIPGDDCVNANNCHDMAWCNTKVDAPAGHRNKFFESCHGTATRTGANIPRKDIFFCDYGTESPTQQMQGDEQVQGDEPPMQSAVLLQTKAAAIMQLEVIAKKYVNAESYNKLQADNVFSEDKTSKAIGFIVELEAELAKEESTVTKAVAADIAAAGLRKSTDDTAAEKNYNDQEATHVKIVAGFQGVWDAKAKVQSTEQGTYDDLLAKETAAVTAHETAEKIEAEEQKTADKKKEDDDKASTDYHHAHTTNILALKDSDSEYIADEQADIKALQAIVVKLNLRFTSM